MVSRSQADGATRTKVQSFRKAREPRQLPTGPQPPGTGPSLGQALFTLNSFSVPLCLPGQEERGGVLTPWPETVYFLIGCPLTCCLIVSP